MTSRDSQRSAIYAWESMICKAWPRCNEKLTLEECVELIRQVWEDYRPGQTPPIVGDGRGRRRACGNRGQIKLPTWARTKIMVLHEVAHSLQQTRPWHGPEFARLALELWSEYAFLPLAPAKRLGVHQKPRRVHFAATAACPKPKKQEKNP